MNVMEKLFSYRAGVAFFFIACVLLMLAPTLRGLVLFPPDSDIIVYYYPVFHFFSEALHAGQSFLWMPAIYSGFPIYLSQVGGFFDPINIFIFKLFSGITGMHVRLGLDFLFTFVFSYLASRAIGLSRLSSALVGPAYLLSFHWRFLSNPLTANSLFLMPFLIYSAIKMLEGQGMLWRYVLLCGIGLGIAILGGYTQVVFYAILFLGLFSLGYFFLIEHERTYKRAVRALAHLSSVVFLGVCIGLPQIVPALLYVPETVRSEGLTYELAVLKVLEPGDMLLAVVPDYFYVPYITAGRKPLFVGAFWFLLAIGALLVSIAAIVRARNRVSLGKQELYGVIFSGLFLFALIAAFKWSPIFYLLHQLPVFELFRFPFRFMFVGTFFLALLGGIGLDMVARLTASRLFAWWTYFFAASAGVFVGGLVLLQALVATGKDSIVSFFDALLGVFFYGRFGLDKDPAQYRDAIGRGLDAVRELLTFTNPAIAIPLLLLLLSAAVAILAVRKVISPHSMRSAGALLTIATFIVVFVAGWRWSAPPTALGTTGTVLTEHLSEEDASLYRFYPFLPSYGTSQKIPPQYKLSREEERAGTQVMVRSGVYNMHLYGDMSSVDGYDQFLPHSTLQALERIGSELAAGGVQNYGVSTPEERRDLFLENLRVLGLMGGKYVISGIPLVHPDLRLLSTTLLTKYEIPLYVYEYAYPLPRFYIARQTINFPHTSFSELGDQVPTLFKTYLDCADCAVPSGAGAFKVLRQENGLYEFKVTLQAPQYLVLSESYLPGWRVELDGTPAKIVRANGLYMAIFVPGGEHTVWFEYRGMLDELSVLRALNIVGQ